ncbi:hypothetical protein [Enemella evansiae]|uniref:hypothetical protein n=1 Tax=Enemella evansiae TaxID=2016499 RepID=UPI00105C23F4|nr:hypothetical protein [Enemella evansiae]TDO91881.1 hypothetical protein C8D81_2194 [Enemella evansiae]
MKPTELFQAVRDGRLSEVEDEVREQLDLTLEDGSTLLEAAALILGDPQLRYQSVQRLIELGIDVPVASRGRSGVLNVLIGAKKQELDGLLTTTRILLDKGADAGFVSQQERTPSMELVNSKFDESELAPLYPDWFARDDLNLGHRNKAGVDAQTLAERRERPEFLSAAQDWVAAHPG